MKGRKAEAQGSNGVKTGKQRKSEKMKSRNTQE